MSKKSMKQFNERKTAQKPMQNTQPKKVKKREVEAWILAIFMIAWTVCSVLGTIGFCRTQASADSVDAVDTVSVIDEKAVECSTAYNSKRIRSNADVNVLDYVNFPLYAFNSLIFRDETDISVFAGRFSINLASAVSYSLVFESTEEEISFDLLDETTNPIYYQYVNDLGAYNTGYVTVYCLSAPYDMPYAEMISNVPDLLDYYPQSYKLNSVYYDDMNGGYVFEIALRYAHRTLQNVFRTDYIIVDTSFIEPFDFYTLAYNDLLPTDYYPILGLSYSSIDTNYYQEYFNQGFNEGQAFGEQIGFDNGFTEGVRDGREQGYIEGRDFGYDEGYSNGRQQGYNEGRADGFTQGVADANEYTFAGLIGAVFDAPIQAFQGLFSFEVLGVDLSGFLLSLLTCGIALCIIKLII